MCITTNTFFNSGKILNLFGIVKVKISWFFLNLCLKCLSFMSKLPSLASTPTINLSILESKGVETSTSDILKFVVISRDNSTIFLPKHEKHIGISIQNSCMLIATGNLDLSLHQRFLYNEFDSLHKWGILFLEYLRSRFHGRTELPGTILPPPINPLFPSNNHVVIATGDIENWDIFGRWVQQRETVDVPAPHENSWF